MFSNFKDFLKIDKLIIYFPGELLMLLKLILNTRLMVVYFHKLHVRVYDRNECKNVFKKKNLKALSQIKKYLNFTYI